MAFMIPPTLTNQPDTTAGERKLFRLFQNTLPDSCIVRYEVLLGERDYRPDYVLIDPTHGVLIVEVKDWGLSSIVKATPEQFLVRYRNNVPRPQRNPNQKCQIYLRHTRESLSAMPELLDETGRLQTAIHYFVAFPNLTLEEFTSQDFEALIPREHVLLNEDLVTNGEPFRLRYHEMLPSRTVPYTEIWLNAVQKTLFPDTSIPTLTEHGFIPAEQKIVDTEASTVTTHQLSLEQEQIAKSLGEGPRLLRGIAGTGKTLIMLYRAKILAANNENWRTLILCWNTSLGNYMKQAYDRFHFEAKGEVIIQHFADFARDLFQQSYVDFEDRYFDERFDAIAAKASTEKYNAIYIDEAQDFKREWIKSIYDHLLIGEPKERNLLIAADDAQRIYRGRNFRWSDLGIDMRGRSKILKTVYRNSARVWIFSAFLLKEKASYIRDSENEGRVQFSTKGGYDPQLIECDSLQGQIDRVIQIIKLMLEKDFAAKNVLILYRHKSVRGFRLVERLLDCLEEERVPCDWIAESGDAKRNFDWDANTVKISTVHSGKGMDSPIVFVLGAETFDPNIYSNEYDEVRLMYVALTRAREFLVILHTGNGGLVPELKYCKEQYDQYRDAIIDTFE